MARLFDDGSSQYLSVANGIVASPTLFTLAAWARSDDSSVDNGVIGLYATNKNQATAEIRLDAGGGSVRLYYRSIAGGRNSITTAGYSVNTWHHVCAVIASSTSRTIYLDGGNSGSDVVDRTAAAFVECHIGWAEYGNDYMSGRICEVAIWNVALLAAQVASLAAGAHPYEIEPDSLVFYYPGLRTDQDLVGGHDMTAYGSPTWAEHAPKVCWPMPGQVYALAAGGPINEDVSLSLARSAVVISSGAGAAVAAATLARQMALTNAGTAAAVAAATLTRQAALTKGASAAALRAATLARQAALTQVGQAAAGASTTLSRQGGVTDGAAAAAGASLSLSVVKAATQAAVAAALGDAMLTNLRGISQSATSAAAARL